MSVEVESSPGLAEARAVPFRGTWELRGDVIHLTPFDDLRITVTMRTKDVEIRSGLAYVRIGAVAEFDIPADSAIAGVKASEGHSDCGGGKTRCVGETEYCCDSNRSVGSCKGGWTC